MRVRNILFSRAAKFWWWLRQVTGDAAYENYLQYVSNKTAHGPECGRPDSESAVTEKQFYLDRVNRKFTRINRCC